jgi:branched-chain amino acid transport system permease protein
MNSVLQSKFLWLGFIAVITAIPIVGSPYVVGVMCFIAIFGGLAVGMGLLLGQAGIFSLAHPVWFGLGGYVSGILAVRGIASPWLGSIIGAIFVGFVSYVIGAPLLRLKGYYLACATFGLLIIVQTSLGQIKSLTGGHEGLMGIPPFSFGGFVLETDLHYYYLFWALCLACLWFLYNLMGSRIGRAIKSFHDSEIAARSMGINVPLYKLKIFILTSVMASFAGSFYTCYLRFAEPGIFGFSLQVQLMTMVIIGGSRTLYGPLLGGFVVMWLMELINMYLGKVLPRMGAQVNALFFGILIIVILIFMPGGLSGWTDRLLNLGRRTIGKTSG